ncbi:hypothetical protein JCM11491_004204 [Sporobolomyces phaffii]
MAQPGSHHHQESPLVRSGTLKRSLEVESMDGSPPLPHQQLQPSSAGTATSTTTQPGGPPVKKRITRKRAILSCRNCTSRKIRCERDNPGSACRACDKRGESALCDPGSTPGANNVNSGDLNCGDHRADLERRVSHLENMLLGQGMPPSHQRRPSSVTANGASPPGPGGGGRELVRAKSEDNISETEEAAMTLEDIAVNVRVSAPQTVRQVAPPHSVYGPTAAVPPPSHSASRYRESLLVPQISKRWSSVLEDLFAGMPTRPKMDFLIQYYFANVSWFWLPYHAPTFLAEYDAFHQLLREGRQLEVDPLWLAVLFLTLANSANSIDYLPPGTDFTYEELTGMFSRYFEDGRVAIDCGDGYGTFARIRTIQAVVLLGPLALNSGDPGRVDVLIPYVAATMRTAQQLGLDKLGSDPSAMPTIEDPALPPGKSSLRREIALRAFHSLCHIDQTTFRCRPVLPMHLVDSAFPGNYNDQDLTPDALTAPAPSNVRTISAYETLRFRVGMIQRAFHDTVVLDPSYTYADVLHCDTEMRHLLEEYDLERPEPNETTPMFWARIFSLQNINIRLIRFHRPFASKGYRDPALRNATDLALAAARVVLECQKELDRTQCPLVKDCYQLNHVQIAIVVLFSTIWYDQEAEAQPSADYRLISDATAAFHRALSSIRERVRNVARQSLLVVQCLFEAYHNRANNPRKENYAQVLKRISMIVTDAERRAATASTNESSVPLNGHVSQPPTHTPYPGPPNSQPHHSGPVDARGVLIDTNGPQHGQNPHHHHHQQQQPQHQPPQQYGYPGPIYHRPSGNVPCGACVKRNQASSCQSQPRKRKSKAGVDPSQELDTRRRSALEELALFRQTLDSLKARLPNLEYFVANSSIKEGDEARELDEIVKSFGDPVTDLGDAVDEGTFPTKRPVLPSVGSSRDLEPAAKKQKKEPADESEVNVQAAIDLEFSALGRPRRNEWNSSTHQAHYHDPDEGSPSHHYAVLGPEPPSDSPIALFPDNETLSSAAPSPLEEDVIFRVGLDRYGWHHSVIHRPTFYGQLAAFRDLGEDRFDRASLSWMSGYFALLAVSTKLLGQDEQAELDWTEEETSEAAARWFNCSISCLYRHNFLQAHDFTCLQAISLLVLSGRDCGSATLIASLLSSGISIAQDLGLHRLSTDEQWDESLKGRPARQRAKALIEREMKKRVLWALVHSEWFAIPFKGYSLLAKLRIETPLPLNATDEDLATGTLVDRPRDEFTYSSWLIQYIDIGASMASAFESKDIIAKVSSSQAYQAFLQADKQLEAMLTSLPAWLKSDGPTEGMPESVDPNHLRSTFLISLQHKILSIHRPFLAKPSRATTYAFSHRRVVDAARTILREAVRVQGVRIWTVLYHISVATFSMSLELFEQLKSPSPDNEAIRNEIQSALPTLEGLKDASQIAERGLNLVLPLLADEKRLQSEVSTDKRGKRKTKTIAAGSRATPNAASTTSGAPLPSPSSVSVPHPHSSVLFGTSSSQAFPSHPVNASASPSLPPHASPGATSAPLPSPYDPSVPAWLYGETFLYSHLSGNGPDHPPPLYANPYGPGAAGHHMWGLPPPPPPPQGHEPWGWGAEGDPARFRSRETTEDVEADSARAP